MMRFRDIQNLGKKLLALASAAKCEANQVKDENLMRGPNQYYLRRCSLTLRYQIKKVITHQRWKSIFSNSWVLNETTRSITLAVPRDMADLAQTYGSKIQSITGKVVNIVPGTDDMSHITQEAFS